MLTRFRKWGVRDGSGESVSLSQGQQRDTIIHAHNHTCDKYTFMWLCAVLQKTKYTPWFNSYLQQQEL